MRGRTMDALEKIARVRPHLVMPAFVQILDLLENKQTMMVRMHAAMLFGHLVVFNETIPLTFPVLLDMLDDEAVFTKNWAITSLCIIAGMEPDFTEELIQRIAKMQNDPSPAVRTRVRKALEFLTDPKKPFPRGWKKSKRFGIS